MHEARPMRAAPALIHGSMVAIIYLAIIYT